MLESAAVISKSSISAGLTSRFPPIADTTSFWKTTVLKVPLTDIFANSEKSCVTRNPFPIKPETKLLDAMSPETVMSLIPVKLWLLKEKVAPACPDSIARTLTGVISSTTPAPVLSRPRSLFVALTS